MSRIPVSQIVNDIRSGMSDGELRTRYKLSTKGLHRLLRILVYEKAISHDELYERSHAYRSVSDLLASRHSPRIYVPIPLRILSKGESESGFVRDMSETGVRVAGMNAKVGDIMTLCLPLNQLPITRSIEFDAVCRWSRIEGKNRKYLVTGFEIIDISEEAQKSFIDLIVFFQSQGKAELRWLYGSLDETDLSESQREAVAAEELSPEFSGTVHGVDILDFVQFLMLTGKRTLLHVRSSTGDECELHVDHGKITHAVHGVKEGHEAFFECMNFPGGVFFTEPWRPPLQQTIDYPGDVLLFKAAQRRDELLGMTPLKEERLGPDVTIPLDRERAEGIGTDEYPIRYPIGVFPIYDLDDLVHAGHMREFSEKEFIVTGIKTQVGEKKNLLIHVEDLPDIYPFSFEAQCRWTKLEPDGTLVAGFEITDMPEKGPEELEKAVKWLAYLE